MIKYKKILLSMRYLQAVKLFHEKKFLPFLAGKFINKHCKKCIHGKVTIY